MKTFLILSLAAFSASAFADGSAQPNLFSCTGDKIDVTFAATGIDGEASLRIAESGLAPVTYRGNAISFQKSFLGTAASVVTMHAFDVFTTTASFLIPSVNVDGFNDVKNVKTILITETQHTSIAGPRFVEGVLTEYRAVNLNCVVQFVNF